VAALAAGSRARELPGLREPVPGGTLVLTHETERGPLPWWLRWYLRGALHGAHQEWLESLERVVKNGPPKS